MNRIIVGVTLALLAACDPPPDLRLYDAGADDAWIGTPPESDAASAAWCEQEPQCPFDPIWFTSNPQYDGIYRELCTGVYTKNLCNRPCWKCDTKLIEERGSCWYVADKQSPDIKWTCVRECHHCL